MNNIPLFLSPVFKERIWGGNRLREQFGYDIPSERTGECWAISAHPNGQTIVTNEPFRGKTLGALWEQHPELFGYFPADRFPLLTKILDANADLSVQVHPNDEYARTYEHGELGKTECWYIIDCKDGAELIYGHYAKTKEELRQMMEEGRWHDLLRKVPIRPGDFFYVPSGTVHALCEGTLVLETQQNSDTTYRMYDYDRIDEKGNKRELHLDKAIDVVVVPHVDVHYEPYVIQTTGARITIFVENEYFTVQKWDIEREWHVKQVDHFLLVSVLEGEGDLHTSQQTYRVRKGDHFILPHSLDGFTLSGNLRCIVSSPSWPK